MVRPATRRGISQGHVRRASRAALAALVCLLAVGAWADVAAASTSATMTSLAGRTAVGFLHSCAVQGDGTPVCWGDDTYHQSAIPLGLGKVTQIATGTNHTCAIKADRTVACWGQNDYGQIDLPDGLGTVTQVDAAGNHTCVVRTDGTPVCWGDSRDGDVDHPTNLITIPDGVAPVLQISTGADHQCAVRIDHTPVCWGTNTFGEAVVPGGVGTVRQISAGDLHTCVLKTDGTPFCWGRPGTELPAGGVGSLLQISAGRAHTCGITVAHAAVCWGDDGVKQSTVPAGTGTVTQISAGEFGSCAITTGGDLRCWGYDKTSRPDMGVPLIAAGTRHSCAIRVDSTPVCWGDDAQGQRTIPAGVGSAAAISAGDAHTCAIRPDGTVACWGSDAHGQSTVPAGLGPVIALSAGGAHTCAVTADGTAVCWGDDAQGQSTVPPGLGPVVAITAGGTHTCAIKADGAPACWGDDSLGQSTPHPGATTVTDVAAGARHTCALAAGAQVFCWGDGDAGQTGAPDFVTQVTAGGSHTCGITRPGAALCWGDYHSGQTSVPAGLGPVTQISAGDTHTCAVSVGGQASCWGNPTDGRLGGAPSFTDADPSGTLNADAYTHTFTSGPAAGPAARFTVTFGTLPPGLSLDGGTGELSGTPTTDGQYTATITAANGVFGPDATRTVTFTVHATRPFAPIGLAVSPGSPSASLAPAVTGIAAPGTTVRLYDNAGCTGTPLAAGTAAAFAGAGLAVSVPADSTTAIHASAQDAYGNASVCSSGATYVNDRAAPAAPGGLASTPASPNASLVTAITGTAEAGSTVRVYAGATCTGTQVASGPAATFAAPGLPVAVTADSTSTFSATATDAAGNTSACSGALSYVNEQPTGPPSPNVITQLSTGGWCLGAGGGGRKDLSIRYTTAQDATVIFSLQRRTAPASNGARRCPAQPPVGNGTFVTATAAVRAVGARAAGAPAGAAARRRLTLIRTDPAGTHGMWLLRAFGIPSLGPGVYRLRITPVTADGTAGVVRTVTFVVLRPKRR